MSIPEPPALLENDAPAHPLVLFTEWYQAAEKAGLTEPGAMALATVTTAGLPDARMTT